MNAVKYFAGSTSGQRTPVEPRYQGYPTQVRSQDVFCIDVELSWVLTCPFACGLVSHFSIGIAKYGLSLN